MAMKRKPLFIFDDLNGSNTEVVKTIKKSKLEQMGGKNTRVTGNLQYYKL